jgi:hypothetical protein
MAKQTNYPKDTTTHRDGAPPKRQDWKRDRWEQRNAKVTARRTITGGF